MSLKYKFIKYTKNILTLLLAALMIFSCLPAFPAKADDTESSSDSWPDCPSIKAKAACVINADTGTVLFSKHCKKKEYPASITKIMTALLSLEKSSSMSEDVEFTDEAVNTGDSESSSIGMLVGEKLTLEQALYGMLLASANEAANAIAIHTGGDLDSFVDMMNKKAADLGCINTHFANPCGLYNPDHYTCAYDMALIAREAVKNPDFIKIAGSRKYVIPKTNLMDEERPLANTHQMINPAENPEYAYEYCYAGKTGYTSEAGYTLVSCAKKGNLNVICVVMNASCRADQYESSLKLLDYAFKRFRMETADKVTLNPVVTGSALYNRLVKKDPDALITASGSALLSIPKKCDFDAITTECQYDDSITELKKGQNVIGSVDYTYRKHHIGSAELLYTGANNITLTEEEEVPSASAVNIKNSAETGEPEPAESFLTEILDFFIHTPKGRITLLAAAAAIVLLIVYIIKVVIPRRKRRKRYMMHKKLRKISGIDKRHIHF